VIEHSIMLLRLDYGNALPHCMSASRLTAARSTELTGYVVVSGLCSANVTHRQLHRLPLCQWIAW